MSPSRTVLQRICRRCTRLAWYCWCAVCIAVSCYRPMLARQADRALTRACIVTMCIERACAPACMGNNDSIRIGSRRAPWDSRKLAVDSGRGAGGRRAAQAPGAGTARDRSACGQPRRAAAQAGPVQTEEAADQAPRGAAAHRTHADARAASSPDGYRPTPDRARAFASSRPAVRRALPPPSPPDAGRRSTAATAAAAPTPAARATTAASATP